VVAAALLFGKLPSGVGKVGVILSGGNMDLDQLAAYGTDAVEDDAMQPN
jgi:hypothetical protein